MKSSTLKSSILALTLSGAIAWTAPSYAAPQYTFTPVKNWVAEDMQNPNAGSGQVCTVRNEYNNGFVLQFAASQNGLELLAINFRQDIFEAGRDYTVSMTAGNGAPASFKARANKADQLKIFTNGQKDFYQAVKSAPFIDMNIEGNEFRFEMGGFTQAANDLERCMGKAPAPTPLAMQTPPPAPTKSAPSPVSAPVALMPPPVMAAPVQSAAVAAPSEDRMSVRMSDDPFDNRPSRVVNEGDRAAREEIFSNHKAAKETEATALPPVEKEKVAAAAPAMEPPPLPVQKETAPVKENPRKGLVVPPPAPVAALAPQTPPIETKTQPAQTAALPLPLPTPKTETPPAPAAEKKPAAEAISWNEAPKKPSEAAMVTPVPSAPAPAPVTPEKIPQPEQIMASAPPVEMAPTAPPVPRVKTENIKSPEMKIHRESASMEADFTKVERNFQRGGEGPSVEKSVEPVVVPERLAQKKDDQPFETTVRPLPQEKIVYRADPEMAMKISELEQTVQKLKAQNDMLESDLKTNVADSRQERASIASENWDLEKASLRYSEAEREVKRLASKLQQERAQCDVEKKDLEGMLFDPRVTDEQQMAKLADLEQKLSEANQALADQRMRYEERIKAMESR